MGGHFLLEVMSYGRVYLTGGHVLLEAYLKGGHVLEHGHVLEEVFFWNTNITDKICITGEHLA